VTLKLNVTYCLIRLPFSLWMPPRIWHNRDVTVELSRGGCFGGWTVGPNATIELKLGVDMRHRVDAFQHFLFAERYKSAGDIIRGSSIPGNLQFGGAMQARCS
jgi:hypothetical protein